MRETRMEGLRELVEQLECQYVISTSRDKTC